MTQPVTVLDNIGQLLTMRGGGDGLLGVHTNASLAIAGREVVEIGRAGELATDSHDVVDVGGKVVMPGLVDCHTHLIYGGDRVVDFALRCEGVSYLEMAQRGGGIRRTMRRTRSSTLADLVLSGRKRLDTLMRRGVTHVEIKSGYGLELETELMQLRAARELASTTPVHITTTLLAAHVIPPEFEGRSQAYVRHIVDTILPQAVDEGLVDQLDVYCDKGAFSLDEAETLFRAARASGLPFKAHGEQLSHTGVARLAAELGAVSVDHLEHLRADAVAAMADSGTVAVLLPTASLYLGDSGRPPVAALREAGVPMALATDHNPGSSPTLNPWLVGTLASTWYGLSVQESLFGLTAAGGRALGLATGGLLQVGGPADFVVTTVSDWRELLYRFGDDNPAAATWIGGQRVC